MVMLDLMAFFLLSFIITCSYAAFEIVTVFHVLVKVGGFSVCWRLENIMPVSKFGSANSYPSYYRPITFTPVLSRTGVLIGV